MKSPAQLASKKAAHGLTLAKFIRIAASGAALRRIAFQSPSLAILNVHASGVA